MANSSTEASEQRKVIGQAVKVRLRGFKSEAAKYKPRVLRMKEQLALDAAWSAAWGSQEGFYSLQMACSSTIAGLAMDLNEQGRAFENLLGSGDLRGGVLAWSKTPIDSIWSPTRRQGYLGQAWSASMVALEALGVPCQMRDRKACEAFSSHALGWAMRSCLEADLDDAHLEAISWESRLMSGEALALPFDTARERAEHLGSAREDLRAFNAKIEGQSIDASLWSRFAGASKPRPRL